MCCNYVGGARITLVFNVMALLTSRKKYPMAVFFSFLTFFVLYVNTPSLVDHVINALVRCFVETSYLSWARLAGSWPPSHAERLLRNTDTLNQNCNLSLVHDRGQLRLMRPVQCNITRATTTIIHACNTTSRYSTGITGSPRLAQISFPWQQGSAPTTFCMVPLNRPSPKTPW